MVMNTVPIYLLIIDNFPLRLQSYSLFEYNLQAENNSTSWFEQKKKIYGYFFNKWANKF